MRKLLWILATLLVSFVFLGCKSTEPKNFALPEANNYEESARRLSAAEINATDTNGNTILHIAAQRNNVDLILYLLAKGADSRIINKNRDSALHVAIKNNNKEAAGVLAERDGDIFIRDSDNKTALEAGLEKGSGFFDILIKPATMKMTDSSGQYIVHYLVKNRNSDALDYCIQKDFPLSNVDRNGFSPLWGAFAGNKNLPDIYIAVKLLLANAVPIRGDYGYFEDAILSRNYSIRSDDGQTPLHVAAIQGHTGIVQYLLERGATVSAQDSLGATPLHEAVRYGRVDIVALLLEKGASPNIQDVMGKTPLLLVVPRGTQQETYTLLLANGANSAAKDMFGDTSLHVAILNNVEVSIFSRLLTPRIDINERNKQGVTPLALAVEHEQSNIVAYLVQKGADIHAKDYSGGTPLTKAFTQYPDMLSLLVPANMVAVRDSYGNTPLHIGVMNMNVDSSLDQLKYLLDASSDINARNNAGDTPISLIIQDNKRFIGEMLLVRGAEVFSPNANNVSPLKMALSYQDGSRDWILLPELIKSTDGSGNTPLHYAAEWKIDRAVSVILDQGANSNAKNANGETPLFSAVKVNSPSTIQLLVERGAAKDGWDSFGNTPLHTSVHWDAKDATSCLITFGSDINAKNNSGRSALGEAARAGKLEIASILVENGADVNAVDTTGKSVLIDAIQNGNVEVVRLLINNGASPQIQEMHGRNAYHEAADTGSIEMITLIREAGGNPLSRDTDGVTPFSSVLTKNPEIVMAILGNDINMIDSDGNTPLHIAIESKASDENIALLIAIGYPLNRRNRFGVTPLMLAISEKNTSATALLLQNGSDPYIADNAGECAVSVALKANSDVLSSIVRLAGTKTDLRGDGLLHYAAQVADSETVRKLLSMGLDKSIRNVSGETPYDIAVRWEKRDVARLLQ
jgi:ankyrin repeat protein